MLNQVKRKKLHSGHISLVKYYLKQFPADLIR